ncbi:MAG: geranylgeranylglycerol-phosphate geranylgeranyltransferase [Candidatus Latescibacterota bacterium]
MKRITATIEVVRPHNMLAAAACVCAGYYIAGGRDIRSIAYPVILTAFTVGFGNLINDYYDADIDQVNKPRRPIPSGRLTQQYVRTLYLLGSLVLTLCSFQLVALRFAGIIWIWELLLFLYAWKLKRMPLIGHVLVSMVASSAFLGGAFVAGRLAAVAFPVFFAFMFVMGRELVKGAEDVEGDKFVGANTLSVRLGVERTGGLAVFCMMICVVAAPIPVLLTGYGLPYALVMELIVVPGLFVAAYQVLRNPAQTVLNRVSWIMKIEMFCGIVAMTLGSA